MRRLAARLVCRRRGHVPRQRSVPGRYDYRSGFQMLDWVYDCERCEKRLSAHEYLTHPGAQLAAAKYILERYGPASRSKHGWGDCAPRDPCDADEPVSRVEAEFGGWGDGD